MTYKVYLNLAVGKKIWVKKEFRTKAEAQKGLAAAKKEVGAVTEIANVGIVEVASTPKTASKPASTSKTSKKSKAVAVPTTGLSVIKFEKNGINHLVGIAPEQLNLVKQTFTSIKCNTAKLSLTPSKMTITAIDAGHISVVRLVVPVRTGSGISADINPTDFVKMVGNSIYCHDVGYLIGNPEGPFRSFPLKKTVKAQASAKSLRDMLAPYSKGKAGEFYRITIEIGTKSRATTTDEEHVPVSTSVPLRKLTGANQNVKSYYQTKYIYNALKMFGSTSIVLGMMKNNTPVAISGINKGIKIEYICAPVIDND